LIISASSALQTTPTYQNPEAQKQNAVTKPLRHFDSCFDSERMLK
jgi:hypothetical protein